MSAADHECDRPAGTDVRQSVRAVLDPELNDTSVSLDILRIVAAQLVVIGHAISFFGVASRFSPPNFPYIQNIGVIVFFVLSGFVIGHALVRGLSDPSYGLINFVIDRTARIYSAYLPALLVIAAIDGALLSYVNFQYEAYLGWNNFLGNTVMLQNYLGPFEGVPSYGSAGHLWSVAVEFHIYLFVGAFVFAVVGRNWWWGCLLAAVASPVPLAFFSGDSHGLPGTGLFILWLLGFSIYYACHAGVGIRVPKELLFASVMVFGIIWFHQTVPGTEYKIKNYAIVAMAFLALVLATQKTSHFSSMSRLRSLIRFCANYSFSLYLLHHSILYCLSRIWPSGAEIGAIIGILLSNALAIPFAYCTEFRHKILAEWLRRISHRTQQRVADVLQLKVRG